MIGPLGGSICFLAGGWLLWDVQFGKGRELNGPGPLIDLFMTIQHLAIGIVVIGLGFFVFGFVMWRRMVRQRRG